MSRELRLESLSVGYRRRALLSELSAVAEPGVVTVLLGPNGSGKSTLLRTIAALQPAVGGRVLLGEVDLLHLDPRARAREVACVLTDRFDPGLLRGFDVVALGRRPHVGFGGLQAHDLAAISAAASAVRAELLLSTPFGELSDGQRQRILIARALAQQPAVLVLDEPSAFLDAPGRVELLDVLQHIAAAREIPVLISTHDVEAALQVGRDAWVIDHGVVRTGTVEVLSDSVIGRAFDTDAVTFDPEHRRFRLRDP